MIASLLGPHAGFILASYAVTFIAVVALVAWVVLDHREQKRALADLERRGIGRRARAARGEAA